MKHILRVASGLLLASLIPIVTVGQRAANADLSAEEAAEEMCASFMTALDLSIGGYLTARDPGSRINIRAGAGTQYPVRHQAVVGDEIDNPLDLEAVSDGYCWFKVRLTRSGVVGWVRSDFVELNIP
ncbi:SH3 domain-containing protein [Thermoleptolyngbya sp.]